VTDRKFNAVRKTVHLQWKGVICPEDKFLLSFIKFVLQDFVNVHFDARGSFVVKALCYKRCFKNPMM
jgi:hypothetical protein